MTLFIGLPILLITLVTGQLYLGLVGLTILMIWSVCETLHLIVKAADDRDKYKGYVRSVKKYSR